MAMRVIKRAKLAEFWQRWPAARKPLKEWYRAARRATWRRFPDVPATFGQADVARVGSGNTVVVFDVGGNKFRLIVRVSYEKGKAYVLRVLTHPEYDRGRWKEEL